MAHCQCACKSTRASQPAQATRHPVDQSRGLRGALFGMAAAAAWRDAVAAALDPRAHASTPVHVAALVALAVASLVVANMVAGCMVRARDRRVEEKCARLAAARVGDPIPVTIVTGFLGAGKTVLLNRLLAHPAGHRLCIIENEVGAVSIDHSLLASTTTTPSGAAVMVLKNGCMCCSAATAGDELERTLDRILQVIDLQRASSTAAPFDYLVVETSGVVDPAPILQAFFRADVSQHFFIDAVVTVVDAKHVRYHLDAEGVLSRAKEAGRQVAYADVVLLNKVDLVTADERAAAVAAVRRVNPAATLVETSYAAVDAAAVLDLRRFDVDRAAAIDPVALAPAAPRIRGKHSAGIVTVTLAAPLRGAAADERQLKAWLQALVGAQWRALYRIKGLLYVRSRDARGRSRDVPFVVHGVHEELHGAIMEPPPAAPFEPALVLIGASLDGDALAASFAANVTTYPCTAAAAATAAACTADHHGTHDGHSHGAALPTPTPAADAAGTARRRRATSPHT